MAEVLKESRLLSVVCKVVGHDWRQAHRGEAIRLRKDRRFSELVKYECSRCGRSVLARARG